MAREHSTTDSPYMVPIVVMLSAVVLRSARHSPTTRAAPAISRAVVLCKQRKSAAGSGGADDELIASLNMAMNSWSDFDDAKRPAAPTKNAAKQTSKRTGKDGKLYLRDGPKRPQAMTKLARRRMGTDATAAASAAAVVDTTALKAKVRVEESKSGGGKRATTIRGLSRDAAKSVLKELKAALSVGGRVNARGDVEVQGAHAEICLIRLQKAGYSDVRLAGGAGAVKAPAWNAPQEVRDRAAAQKQAAKAAAGKRAEKARVAARAPAAVAAKMLAQLRASEQLEIAKLRRSDVPRAEKALAQEKLDRIQRRIAEAGG